jgi:DNA-binding MarR family transcriptional regulator
MRRRLVTARLITVVNLVNKSAALAYRRETGLLDFDWRVLSVIGWRAPLTFTELAARLSHDKGQISRSVKRLCQKGLVSHPHARAALVPTDAGRDVCDRIDRMHAERYVEMTRGMSDPDLEALAGLLERLVANARVLLADELARQEQDIEAPDSADADLASLGRAPGGPPTGNVYSRLVTPWLSTLLGLMRKSAALTFRREVGLSDFDWRVMTQVGEQAPVELSDLVAVLSRDKSQVGRAVTRLEQMGLVRRRRAEGERNVVILVTPQGHVVYVRLAALALRRDEALRRGLKAEEQQSLMDLLDRLRVNAEGLYAKELALQPAGRAGRGRGGELSAAG